MAMDTLEKLNLLLKSVDSLKEAHREMSMKFQRMEKDVTMRQEETAQLIVSRIQKKAPTSPKGNKWQFSFNQSADNTIKDAAAVLDKLKPEQCQAATILKTVKGQLQEGADTIVMQQKLIRLADSSECG